jgi:hypothetical protein
MSGRRSKRHDNTVPFTVVGIQHYDADPKNQSLLDVMLGETYTITKTAENGWWYARSKLGQKGWIPSSYGESFFFSLFQQLRSKFSLHFFSCSTGNKKNISNYTFPKHVNLSQTGKAFDRFFFPFFCLNLSKSCTHFRLLFFVLPFY